MRTFIKHTFLFTLILIGLILLIEINSSLLVRKYSNFKLASNTEFIVLGHSHSECAFNDSLIPDFKNLSQSGESYFYTYFKAKQVLKQNPRIKVVFIEYTNNQINERMNDWIWGEEYMSNSYPKYSSFINFQGQSLLLRKNTKNFANCFSISLKNRLGLIVKGNYNFTNNIGGYLYLVGNKTDSILIPNISKIDKNKSGISEYNISYLVKIIELCEEYGKKPVLIRSPLHKKYTGFFNETRYKEILKKRLNKVEFIDFSKFQLSNSEFGDLEHLNYKGAKIFSEWFSELLDDGLLKKVDIQEYIDNEIELRAYNNGYKKIIEPTKIE